MWLAAWTGRPPAVNRLLVAIFAGNHASQNTASRRSRSSVTQQMVREFRRWRARDQPDLARPFDLGLKVFGPRARLPTTATLPARRRFLSWTAPPTMAFGMEAIALRHRSSLHR